MPKTAAAKKVPAARRALPKWSNQDFYDAKGKFLEDKAKDAYLALLRHHGYPIFDGLKERLWVSDGGVGHFAELGFGAVVFINNVKDRYMVLDFFLLPHQLLPEHYHTATAENPAKMEGWVLRYGEAWIVQPGADNLAETPIKIPACHMNGTVTVRHAVHLKPGQTAGVIEMGERHFQYGGPEGVVITESANVHDGKGLHFSDPAIEKAMSAG